MNRELARKSPAIVVNHRPVPPIPAGRATVQFKSRANLEQKIGELYRQGRIGPEWIVRPRPGGWDAVVTFIPRPAPAPRPFPIVKTMATIVVGIIAVMAGYFVAQALAVAVAAMVPFIIGGLFVLASFALLAGRKVVNIIQSVIVK